MRAKKSLGQNFLMHPRIAERIVLVADLTRDDVVIEIGPGKGILTRELLKRVKHVIAIEADEKLVEELKIKFAHAVSSKHLELISADIRKWPTPGVGQRRYRVVANIPYYLTGEIFRKFLEAPNQPSSMTLLVQKEVAERVARDKKQSILGLSVKAYGTPEYEFTVPRGAFIPAPKVNSAALSVRDISRENFKNSREELRFFELLHAGFAHKRKFVRSNVKGIVSEEALQAAGVRDGARAEDVPLSAWLELMHHAV